MEHLSKSNIKAGTKKVWLRQASLYIELPPPPIYKHYTPPPLYAKSNPHGIYAVPPPFP